jgi:hypothetical protein
MVAEQTAVAIDAFLHQMMADAPDRPAPIIYVYDLAGEAKTGDADREGGECGEAVVRKHR